MTSASDLGAFGGEINSPNLDARRPRVRLNGFHRADPLADALHAC